MIIVGKVIGGLLALLVVGLLVFVSFGVPGDGAEEPQDRSAQIGQLDARARAACELYTPIADDVRSGELTGPPLFRALQDVYNEARLSQAESFEPLVRNLLSSTITGDDGRRDQLQAQLDEVCAD
jgi:hypothetical protein